jgi:hypothetical protein
MANKPKGNGGLFGYGQAQKSKGKDLKLFPAIGDINPNLKEGSPRKRR